MRLLLATNYGYLPDVIGGLQTTLHEFCLALAKRGVEPVVLCGYAGTHNRELATAQSDESMGYLVVRSPDPINALSAVATATSADAVVIHTSTQIVPMIAAAKELGIPLSVSIHNVEHREFGGVLLPDPDIQYFANSRFTARRLDALCGIEAIPLMPLVQPESYHIQSSREKILFINPTQLKGVEILFRVAERLPDIPFRVAESWNLNPAWREYCLSRATDLGNIEWVKPTRDITSLYGSARLLMMPSVWEEAFGRSALEAQHAGIPVIASRRGGLPEAVGDGGVLVGADADIDNWVAKIDQVWKNDSLYQELVAKAQTHANKLKFTPDYIVATLVTAVRNQLHTAQ